MIHFISGLKNGPLFGELLRSFSGGVGLMMFLHGLYHRFLMTWIYSPPNKDSTLAFFFKPKNSCRVPKGPGCSRGGVTGEP